MNKERLGKIVLISVLSFIFLVLAFYVSVIAHADYLDWRLGRLENLQVVKDLILIGWWLALFSLIRKLFKDL